MKTLLALAFVFSAFLSACTFSHCPTYAENDLSTQQPIEEAAPAPELPVLRAAR